MGVVQSLLDFDKGLFLFLNRFHSGYWDTVMLMITRKEFWLPVYAIILYYILRVCGKKTLLVILTLAIAVLVSDQLTLLIKNSVERLRPVYNPNIIDQVHNILRKGGLYGFPSSHASNYFAVFAFTSLLFKNRFYTIMTLSWVLLVSYSRIYSGVHYPSDILAGIVLGLLTGYVLFRIFFILNERIFATLSTQYSKICLNRSQTIIIGMVFIIQMVSLILISWILHKYNFL